MLYLIPQDYKELCAPGYILNVATFKNLREY